MYISEDKTRKYLRTNLKPYVHYVYLLCHDLKLLVFLGELESKGFIEIEAACEHPIGMKRYVKLTSKGRFLAGYIKSYKKTCCRCNKGFMAKYLTEAWCDRCDDVEDLEEEKK